MPTKTRRGSKKSAVKRKGGRLGRHSLILLIILLFAAFLRFYAPTWDATQSPEGRWSVHLQHPDERMVFMTTQRVSLNNLNPEFFAYGSFPFYFLKSLSVGLGKVFPVLLPGHAGFYFLGRIISGIFGLLSVWLTYLIACRLFGRGAGLLAAAFLAFSVLHIQLSHYYAVDVIMVFFVMLVAYLSINIMQRGHWRDYALCGLVGGISLACKFTAIAAIAMPLTAHVLALFTRDYPKREARKGFWWKLTYRSGWMKLLALIYAYAFFFFLAQHYAVHSRVATWIFFGVAGLFWFSSYYFLRFQEIYGGRVWLAARQALFGLLWALAGGVVVASLFWPEKVYWWQFLSNIGEQGRMAGGVGIPCYVLQFRNTPMVFYQLKQFLKWGVGYPLGLLMLGSFFYYVLKNLGLAIYNAVGWLRTRKFLPFSKEELLMLSFSAPFFLITCSFYVKFLRYMIPLYPFFAIFAATFVIWLWRRAKGHKWAGLAIKGYVALALVAAVFYSLAFVNIYSKELTRAAASRWIYANVPAGSSIALEEWDDDLPFHLAGVGHRGIYRYQKMRIYDLDGATFRERIASQLADTDYVVMTSKKLYGTLVNFHAAHKPFIGKLRYDGAKVDINPRPMCASYYQLMFDGGLGFRLAHEEYNYPNLFGIELKDYDVEETFRVYDHQRVLIFKKIEQLSAQEIQQRIETMQASRSPQELLRKPLRLEDPAAAVALVTSPVLPVESTSEATAKESRVTGPVSRVKPTSEATRAPEEERPETRDARRVTSAGTEAQEPEWSGADINKNIGAPMGKLWHLPYHWSTTVLVWLLLVELAGLVALPLMVMLFRRFPDCGYGFSKVAGLLLLAWANWMLVNLRVIPFHQWAVALTLTGLAGLSFWLYRRYREFIRGALVAARKTIRYSELVFLLVFFVFLLIRALMSDVHSIAGHGYGGGGEPLGITYLSTMMRASHFPPHDPWFAPGSSNYYYWGYVILGTLSKLAGYLPWISYNLAIPLLVSLVVAGLFSLLLALTGSRAWSLAGSLVITAGGNIWALLFPIFRRPMMLDFWDWRELTASLRRFLNELTSWNNVWDCTRFHGSNPSLSAGGMIYEFPFFTYLYGDFHPHNIIIPFAVLGLGLGLSAATGLFVFEPGRKAFKAPLMTLGLFLFTAAVTLGMSFPTNTWNYPTMAFILVVCFLYGWWMRSPRRTLRLASLAQGRLSRVKGRRSKRGRGAGRRLFWFKGIGLAVGMILLSFVLYLPFHLHFQRGGTGVHLLRSGERNISTYLLFIYFSPFVIGALALLALNLKPSLSGVADSLKKTWRRVKRRRREKPVALLRRRLGEALFGDGGRTVIFVALCLTLSFCLWLLALGQGLILTSCLLLIFAVLGFFLTAQGHAARFALLLSIASYLIVIGCENIFIADRTNTVFKFYIQAFVFLGLASFYGMFLFCQVYAKWWGGFLKRTLWGWRFLGTVLLIFAGFVITAGWTEEYLLSPLFVVTALLVLLAVLLWSKLDSWIFKLGVVFLAAFPLLTAVVSQRVFSATGETYLGLNWHFLWLACLITASLLLGLKKKSGGARDLLAAVLVVIMLISVGYPLMAVSVKAGLCHQNRRGENPFRLDGLKFLSEKEADTVGRHPYDRHDYQAIIWLWDNMSETRVIVEAPGKDMYSGENRIAIYTGLPTVLGWKHQVTQQHSSVQAGMDAVQRLAHIRMIYRAPSRAKTMELLDRYAVDYVYLGNIERRRYRLPEETKFDGWLPVVYENEGVCIYKVIRDSEL